jgi:hypothetical protein
MTLAEAIKRITEDVAHLREKGNDKLADAEQLGIEALKVVKEFRTGLYKTINSPLPSETQEESCSKESTPRPS